MSDPLADVVGLLRPGPRLVKFVGARGAWGVRRPATGQPTFCVILDGSCRLTMAGRTPLLLGTGDFVLIPASDAFAMSDTATRPGDVVDMTPVETGPNAFRLGEQDGAPDARFIVGHCEFRSPHATLLVSLLPQLVHVRRDSRLTALVELVRDESRAQRPARDVVLARLLEVLLIEALRSPNATTADGTAADGKAEETTASPGLVRGLADARLAAALHRMHDAPERAWTVAELAQEAALSRSAFFERFSRAVGMPPMEYLLAWRMALAQELLQGGTRRIAEVAERVGYSSASTFSVAFTRHVRMPPAQARAVKA